MNKKNFIKLVTAILVSELAGVIGSLFTFPSIPTWYASLVKPPLGPPSWLFGPVWVTLYFLMGIAAYLIWSSFAKATEDKSSFAKASAAAKAMEDKPGDKASNAKIKFALMIFGGQLVLNALWSIIFFGLHQPGVAFFEIILLWLSIVATILLFYRINKPAAYLLLPYLLWVSFASYLNFAIWTLN